MGSPASLFFAQQGYILRSYTTNMTTDKTKKLTVLSGIQTSGELTIGGYIGAVQSWVKMQHEYDCLFMLADLHTLTVAQDPVLLRKRCYDFLALYIACGINPEHNILFAQSHVPEHTQLAWVLNCYTYMGELNRMTQFKDKSKQHAANINVGLFGYPVLMAADVLVYGAHCVPVGEDQKQHMELIRDLALRFNHQYGEVFTVPEPYIPPQGARVMSLQEPTKKMSKSDSNPNSYIALLDDPDTVRHKLKRAVTDSGSGIRFDPEKPGISNLLTLMSATTGQTISQLEESYQEVGYGQFKNDVAEAVVEHLKPIQLQYQALRQDENRLGQILKAGAEAARLRAQKIVKRVYERVGLIV
jgi:tryptophanyl-tRNA synthetase